MKIRVVAFASASDVVGREPIEVDLPPESRLSDLSAELRREYPALEPLWERLAVAVDGELARWDRTLEDGAEVALLPPVSGGAPQPGAPSRGAPQRGAPQPGAPPREDPRARLIDGELDVDELERWVADPHCGAVVLFIGRVRDHHEARRVTHITYSAYRSMARKALQRIIDELETSVEPLRLAVAHRLGEVPAGERSVIIAVSSKHRAPAYEASRIVLERLKREVPIWKREHYDDGEAVWREEEPLPAIQV